MTTTRRHILASAAATLAGGALATAASAAPKALKFSDIKKDTDVACLYHCDFADPQRFSQMLQNINNHYSAYDFDTMKLKIVMVVHSAPIKFFLKDLAGTPWEKETIDPELAKRVEALAKYGLEIYLCQITFKRLKIDEAKAKEDAYIRLVPSGVATVAELQGKGFAYLKVG